MRCSDGSALVFVGSIRCDQGRLASICDQFLDPRWVYVEVRDPQQRVSAATHIYYP